MAYDGHVGLEVVNLCGLYDAQCAKQLADVDAGAKATREHMHRITTLISKMRSLEEKARATKKNVTLDPETIAAIHTFQQETWPYVTSLFESDHATAHQLNPFPDSAPAEGSFSSEDLTTCLQRLEYLTQPLSWNLEDYSHKVRDVAAKAQSMPLIAVAIATHLGKEQEAMVRNQVTR